jgi:rare lipoprotein A (peptidoglycan hydrolase)
MWLWIALLVVMGLALLSAPSRADAAQPWTHATATWYGPGFYGNAFACSAHPRVPDRYSRNVRGVAHMTLPCGSWLRVCRYRRCVRVRVIDRGAFHHRNLDLTARTAMDLCRCVRPYTMQIRYRGA